MFKRLLLIFAAGTCFVTAQTMAAASCEKLIATGSGDYPPYLWRDPANPRKLIGADADLLKQIGKQLGIKVELLYAGTRSEAEEDVRTGRADLLVATPLGLSQLEQMDYVYPAMHKTLVQVWMAKERAFPYAGWDDLLGRPGELPSATPLSSGFDSFARESLQLQRSPDMPAAFQKLLQGQTDFVLAERYPGQIAVARAGLSDQLKIAPPAVSSAGLYLALSHNSACNDAQLRGQLALKMTELVESGVPETLLQRNIQLYQGQQASTVNSQKD